MNLSILLKTLIKILTKFHGLLKKFPKQQLKFMVYQNKVYSFLLQVPIIHLTFLSKIMCLRIPYFLKLSPFELSQITSP
jgi:hypothetical protein